VTLVIATVVATLASVATVVAMVAATVVSVATVVATAVATVTAAVAMVVAAVRLRPLRLKPRLLLRLPRPRLLPLLRPPVPKRDVLAPGH
jgi:hypothetical protein